MNEPSDPPDHKPPALLTVKQAASFLQVSRSIVYALVESGKLLCHRIGLGRGTIRIAPIDLDKYLASTRSTIEESAEAAPPRRTKLRHIRL